MAISRKAWLIIAITTVAVGLFAYFVVRPYYLLATLRVPEDRCPGHERFNPAVWRDSRQVYSSLKPRWCMVDDLLARYSLVGMDHAAVLHLLDDPTKTEYFREYDLVYWLGPERGLMSIDSEWLVMRLSAEGVVTEARLVTD